MRREPKTILPLGGEEEPEGGADTAVDGRPRHTRRVYFHKLRLRAWVGGNAAGESCAFEMKVTETREVKHDNAG